MISGFTYLLLFATVATVPGAGLKGMVESYYSDIMKSKVIRYDIDFRRLPDLAPGAEILGISGEENRVEPPRGTRIVWAEVRQNGRKQQLPVTLVVKPVERVPVAVTDIEARTPLDFDLIEWQELPTKEFGAMHIPSPDDIEGNWAKVRIARGTVLTSRKIDEIPVVRVGQQVRIALKIGNLEVATEGKSCEDGRIGEMIRVINLVNGQKIRCRVQSDGSVTVE